MLYASFFGGGGQCIDFLGVPQKIGKKVNKKDYFRGFGNFWGIFVMSEIPCIFCVGGGETDHVFLWGLRLRQNFRVLLTRSASYSSLEKNQYWLPEMHLSRLFAHSVEGITRSMTYDVTPIVSMGDSQAKSRTVLK